VCVGPCISSENFGSSLACHCFTSNRTLIAVPEMCDRPDQPAITRVLGASPLTLPDCLVQVIMRTTDCENNFVLQRDEVKDTDDIA
jgi:hypothetical protein